MYKNNGYITLMYNNRSAIKNPTSSSLGRRLEHIQRFHIHTYSQDFATTHTHTLHSHIVHQETNSNRCSKNHILKYVSFVSYSVQNLINIKLNIITITSYKKTFSAYLTVSHQHTYCLTLLHPHIVYTHSHIVYQRNKI